MKPNPLFLWVGLVTALQLTACSIKPADKPSSTTFSMAATNKVNPNASGHATPVEYQVFELQDDSMFLSSDFDQLVEDAPKALKSSYITHRDYVLIPGQFKFVERFELNADTYYLGVMARYSSPDESDWKKVVKVLPKGHRYNVLMFFTGHKVNLVSVE